jgi:hypothetical protein
MFTNSFHFSKSHFIERASCPNHEGCVGSQPATPASRFSTSSGTSPMEKNTPPKRRLRHCRKWSYLQSGGNAIMSRCVATTLAAIICSGIAAQAEDKTANDQAPQSAVNIAFGRYGFHSDPKVSTTGCNVLMNLDQKTFLETFQPYS